jgi:transposase-like protein
MVTKVYFCPHCEQSVSVVRHGLTRSGSQRLRCNTCIKAIKAWTPDPKSRALSTEKEGLIVKALGERLSQRSIARTLGVSRDTVRAVLKKAQQARLSFSDTLLPAIKGDALEIDELVIRFRFKRCYKYLWLAISRLTHMVITHQVIGFWIGDRSFQSLWQFWFSLPAAYRKSWSTKAGLHRLLRGVCQAVCHLAVPALRQRQRKNQHC